MDGATETVPAGLEAGGGIAVQDYTFDYTYAVAFNGIQQLLLRSGIS